MKWYKHDPDAFKGGTIGLTLEEIGAYILILDDIYARDGNVPDDPGYLCRLLRSDPRVAKRVRQRLITLGKIHTADGLIANLRATSELSSANIRLSLKQNINENNGATPVRARATTTTRLSEEEEENLFKGFSSSSSSRAERPPMQPEGVAERRKRVQQELAAMTDEEVIEWNKQADAAKQSKKGRNNETRGPNGAHHGQKL